MFKALGDIPNTFWGVCILGASMYMSVKGHVEQAYYFAGIGSTLLGVQGLKDLHNTRTTINTTPEVKVETNAPDSSGKN